MTTEETMTTTTLPLDAPTPTPLPFAMRVTLEVSSNFIDLDDLACLRCGAPFAQSKLSNRRAIVRDTYGDFLDCPACQTRYYARGGCFIEHGAFNQTRWCAQCLAWRPSGLEGCRGEIYECCVCLSEFEGKGPVPAEYAALQAVKARLAAQVARAEGSPSVGAGSGAGE